MAADRKKALGSNRNLPVELRTWAKKEMGLSPPQLPSTSTCRMLCVQQVKDVWEFVIDHVYNARNVKVMEGNVRWHQFYRQSERKTQKNRAEQARRDALKANISMIKADLKVLDEQLATAQREATAYEDSMETNYEKMRDAQRRTLLLKAYARKKERERTKLYDTSKKIEDHADRFKELASKSNVDILPGLQNSSSHLPGVCLPHLEPIVMRDMKEVLNDRYKFMKSLADDCATVPFGYEKDKELHSQSHQQWLSKVEKLLSSHPAKHILIALEHLAQYSTVELKELSSSVDVHKDIETLKFQMANSQLEDVSEPTYMLPSVYSLIEEGWSECEKLCVKQFPLHAQVKDLQFQLHSKMQEVTRLLSDGTEQSRRARDAFDLELKVMSLTACHEVLKTECHTLEAENEKKIDQLRELSQKKEQILKSRQLVERTQEQIQSLIKSNSSSKSQLQKSQTEVQQFVQMKLLQPEKDIQLHVNNLHSGINREVDKFKAIHLPCLRRVTLDGEKRVPLHELSLRRFDRTAPPSFHVLKGIYESLGFPLYKSPDRFFLHVSELKAEILNLEGRKLHERQLLSNLQLQIQSQQPGTQALIKMIRDKDAEQVHLLLDRIKALTEKCSKCINSTKELEIIAQHWWEQPAQFALFSEKRGGLTMREWMDRWQRAVRQLQASVKPQCRGNSQV